MVGSSRPCASYLILCGFRSFESGFKFVFLFLKKLFIKRRGEEGGELIRFIHVLSFPLVNLVRLSFVVRIPPTPPPSFLHCLLQPQASFFKVLAPKSQSTLSSSSSIVSSWYHPMILLIQTGLSISPFCTPLSSIMVIPSPRVGANWKRTMKHYRVLALNVWGA